MLCYDSVMKHDLQTLPDSAVELKAIIASLGDTSSQLEEENRLLRQALFAPKSEKQPPAQLCLFDMPEPLPAADTGDEEELVVPSHTRRKKGRRQLPADLPRIEIVHDISEDISEKLDIVPARMQVIRHVRPKYACRNCEGVADEGGAVKIAPLHRCTRRDWQQPDCRLLC
jgi:transposase